MEKQTKKQKPKGFIYGYQINMLYTLDSDNVKYGSMHLG